MRNEKNLNCGLFCYRSLNGFHKSIQNVGRNTHLHLLFHPTLPSRSFFFLVHFVREQRIVITRLFISELYSTFFTAPVRCLPENETQRFLSIMHLLNFNYNLGTWYMYKMPSIWLTVKILILNTCT